MRFLDEDGGCTVDLPDSVVDRLRTLTRQADRKETGGILIGCYDAAHRSALVSRITGPPRDSVSGPSTFERGTQGLDALLARAWRHRLYYLGEWHSHPEVNPQASEIDALQMSMFASTAGMRCPEPVLLIVGAADVIGHIVCYVYRRKLIALQLAPKSLGPMATASGPNAVGRRLRDNPPKNVKRITL
jgi:integrative and conjugative element protein (TIGR02256 family)